MTLKFLFSGLQITILMAGNLRDMVNTKCITIEKKSITIEKKMNPLGFDQTY